MEPLLIFPVEMLLHSVDSSAVKLVNFLLIDSTGSLYKLGSYCAAMRTSVLKQSQVPSGHDRSDKVEDPMNNGL